MIETTDCTEWDRHNLVESTDQNYWYCIYCKKYFKKK